MIGAIETETGVATLTQVTPRAAADPRLGAARISARPPFPARLDETKRLGDLAQSNDSGARRQAGRLLGARFAYSRAMRPPTVRTVDLYHLVLHEQDAMRRRDDAGI